MSSCLYSFGKSGGTAQTILTTILVLASIYSSETANHAKRSFQPKVRGRVARKIVPHHRVPSPDTSERSPNSVVIHINQSNLPSERGSFGYQVGSSPDKVDTKEGFLERIVNAQEKKGGAAEGGEGEGGEGDLNLEGMQEGETESDLWDHPSNALYWSELHKTDSKFEHPPGRVAVIITGLLRFQDEGHVNRTLVATTGSDVFVVTYSAFYSIALRLSNETVIVTDEELSDERNQRGEPQSGMWQWYLLSRALSFWRSRLLSPGAYHTIVRFRTDMQVPVSFSFQACVGRIHNASKVGMVYALSDSMFYAAPPVFYQVFSSMFAVSRTLYVAVNATKPQEEWYSAKFREYAGFRPSCMLPGDYAALPTRETGLKKSSQATVLFGRGQALKNKPVRDKATAQAEGRRRLAQNNKKGSPRSHPGRPRSPGPQVSPQGKEGRGLVRLFCGCKWGLGVPGPYRLWGGVGWKRGQVAKSRRYQTEPAMAYQILSHNASCLPLDLYHREAFGIYKERSTFAFGVDPEDARRNASNQLIPREPNGDDDDGNSGNNLTQILDPSSYSADFKKEERDKGADLTFQR
mmetsp:Transcript_30990/g.62890  ORF Transcript_30990/g.62890 Transcript_30990/m.62890 type:complete len:577 (-) Transcript_30990:91-1821(-)|eukprot:CAMPEP_0171738922 /NCGR_PEP_ID=MMETSP0991-20121206/33908_1 /TAXON_ID=483369 /ORGANISM="non described non described, Strain CCMP2098" /LENGTH=576 /DNA_ID=CAMNT_0012336405 /DNA_START=104 /DNA_END=1834 /DNA_ORIENTATION=+